MSQKLAIVCEHLHTFYDARILKFLPPKLGKFIKKIVIEEYRKRVDKTVFLNLVYNFFKEKYPTPFYLTGPFTLTYHKSKTYGKQIYIFGENHESRMECKHYGRPVGETMRVNKFLAKVFSTSSVFIDFYLEYQAYKNIEFMRANYEPGIMGEVSEEVSGCIYPNPPKCKWNTMRAHFSDVRSTFEKDKTPPTFMLKVYDYRKIWFITKSELDSLKIILNRYKDPKSFINYVFLEEIPKIPVLVKELKRSTLTEDQFRKILYNFLKDKNVNSENFLPKINVQKLGIEEGHVFDRRIFFGHVLAANVLMDLYQLARIFKKFNVKPGDNQPVEPSYIISYTGNSHSDFLRSALQTLGFDLVKSAESLGAIRVTQCVDVRGLVPLFPNF